MDNKSIFKDSMGRYFTKSLFYETAEKRRYASIYTLKDYDIERNGKTYLSLKKLYLAEADPTEYLFANKYFHSFEQWERIVNNKMFTRIIDTWRRELELKLRAEGLLTMREQAHLGKTDAARFLVNGGWSERAQGADRKKEVKEVADKMTGSDESRVLQLFRGIKNDGVVRSS